MNISYTVIFIAHLRVFSAKNPTNIGNNDLGSIM